MSVRRFLAALALVVAFTLGAAAAQDVAPTAAPTVEQAEEGAGSALETGTQQIAHLLGEERMSTAVEIAVLLTVLSLLPAILITITSFTRIVIVLSFVRRALSTNELPPNPVIIGLALFLTTFVMAPVATRIQEKAWKPYSAGTVSLEQAGDAAWTELSRFLIANTRQSEIDMFKELAHDPQSEGTESAELPLRVVVPAFVLSELKTSFQMGFLLFLPFLVIDLVVSSVLLSMGMFMLPPVMVSTPIKILLFVLVDGWHLVCHSLVTSFVTT
jgi:flagellar biosynthesis protein FliP